MLLTLPTTPQDVDGTPDVSRVYGSPGDDSGPAAPPPYDDHKSTSHEAPEEETTKSAITQVRDKIAQTTQMTYEELKAELDKARAEVVALKQQGQLRLRKAAGNPDKPASEQVATAVKQTVEGVPVHIVATLCFVTFLFAYLFF